jgi:hypothetical protein
MITGDSTFTQEEIDEILKGKNLVPGTEEFQSARRTLFIPTEMQDKDGRPLYIEA